MAMSRQTGFTLIELMVAVTIMGILLAMAMPNLESFVNANKLSSGANEMIAAIQTARTAALDRNRRAVICLSDVPDAATPSCSTANPTGWITFLDVDKDGTFNGADTLLRASTLKSRVVTLSSPAAVGKVIFHSDGLAYTSAGALLDGTIDVCIPTVRPLANARHVCVGSGSRVSVKALTNSACGTAPINLACD